MPGRRNDPGRVPSGAPLDLDRVWYVAYGSNMHADRLRCYLAGGTPPGGRRTYPGCRNPNPPERTVPVVLPGGVYFALESRAWTGGMAFYDPQLDGEAAARAYLVTTSQFADIAAQEMYRPPCDDLDLLRLVEAGRLELGPGRYETLLYVGALDGYPMITFTAPCSAHEVDPAKPAPAYVAFLAGGLRESHGWDTARIAQYLERLPGIHGEWDPAELCRLISKAG
jgi:hypothetical protein